ncbi:DsrE family protein [Pelomicrobium sp.]|jgi:sulfur relay (sulfurtransferase) DsrF/TusC family protein|uniref:DsrE family protein n=1 Tax=Pelomicrobium sp. TaxID=2815319 RepID=UPI002FDEB558
MKVLNVIETAYRATLEEQDDTIVWLTHAMKNAGADLDVLLRGNAVSYGVKNQDASGLAFGTEVQTQPPRIADDLGKLVAKGVHVYIVSEDLTERGIDQADLIEGLTAISRIGIATLLGKYDQIWHW